MPTPQQLQEVAEAGVQFVVNLATPKSEGWMPDEGEVFHRLGVDYLSIRVDWDNPTRQDLQTFMDALDAHNGQRVHVHCQANYRATGFIALYRVLRLGWKQEDAFVDVRKIWNPEEYPVWDKFIQDNLPQK
jgi:protein tyrosine phosphatase (PTP) superfamily phosphohydrolase (DUF442 family)